jgi:integrase
VLKIYKDQWVDEQRHRDLKHTLRVRPVFLHNDARTEGLVAVVGIALLIFGLVEAELRAALGDGAPLPGILPEGRAAKPTARAVLAAFDGLEVSYTKNGLVLDHLSNVQRLILALLGISLPFGLTMDRVDFLRRAARVDRQLVGVRGGVPEFGPPKSMAGFRTVPMPEVICTVVAAHLAHYGPGPGGVVFTNTVGNPLWRNTVNEMWHRAGKQSGLPSWATFHDLRHFYASLLIAKGCSVKVVQSRLGYQSAMETLDTYGHLWPDSDDETRVAVDHVLKALAIG